MRRERLHEFQTRLSERMQAAREDRTWRHNKLAVVAGNVSCLLDLGETSEIMTATGITAVPLTQDWYVGLVNVRGNLFGVVDMSRLAGGPLQLCGAEHRIVLPAATLPVATGLLVSWVIGIVDFAQLGLTPVDTPDVAGAKQLYRDRDGRQWLEISLSALMEDSRFLQVAL